MKRFNRWVGLLLLAGMLSRSVQAADPVMTRTGIGQRPVRLFAGLGASVPVSQDLAFHNLRRRYDPGMAYRVAQGVRLSDQLFL